MKADMPFGDEIISLDLPEGTEVLRMNEAVVLEDPKESVNRAIENPLGTAALDEIVRQKSEEPSAVIVISDNTRPVPYSGEQGILLPLVRKLLNAGVKAQKITILVATGTHRRLSEEELKGMIDPEVFRLDLPIHVHDCRKDPLTHLGKTSRGSEVHVNSLYLDADITILTGLVESHFMAGASGGRKSICPGLIGEESTYIFHGAPMVADANVRDLLLEGNPCHEEALEAAKMAGADFIVNVTLDSSFRLTGVFAGDLVKAHEAAVEHLKGYTAIPLPREYDLVITHGGFVGINHYQAAKGATAAATAAKSGGYVVLAANNSDTDPIGSTRYRAGLQLLKVVGPVAFERMVLSPDWTFIPDQWEVQLWGKVFKKVPQDHFFYYSPQFTEKEYRIIPGRSAADSLSGGRSDKDPSTVKMIIEACVETALEKLREEGVSSPSILYLQDGPYGIPVKDFA